jgi:hypothetical protein
MDRSVLLLCILNSSPQETLDWESAAKEINASVRVNRGFIDIGIFGFGPK